MSYATSGDIIYCELGTVVARHEANCYNIPGICNSQHRLLRAFTAMTVRASLHRD